MHTMNDEIETVDATELPKEKRVELAIRMGNSMVEEAEMRHQAILDDLDADETEITTEWFGDDLAEAMGRAFKTRDTIENHTGRSVEVEHTGKRWTFPSTTYYEFRLTIEEASEDD